MLKKFFFERFFASVQVATASEDAPEFALHMPNLRKVSVLSTLGSYAPTHWWASVPVQHLWQDVLPALEPPVTSFDAHRSQDAHMRRMRQILPAEQSAQPAHAETQRRPAARVSAVWKAVLGPNPAPWSSASAHRWTAVPVCHLRSQVPAPQRTWKTRTSAFRWGGNPVRGVRPRDDEPEETHASSYRRKTISLWAVRQDVPAQRTSSCPQLARPQYRVVSEAREGAGDLSWQLPAEYAERRCRNDKCGWRWSSACDWWLCCGLVICLIIVTYFLCLWLLMLVSRVLALGDLKWFLAVLLCFWSRKKQCTIVSSKACWTGSLVGPLFQLCGQSLFCRTTLREILLSFLHLFV